MENDLPAIRRCGSALQGCGRAVTDHLDENAESLTVTGNTGFTTVGEISTITDDWKTQLTGFGRRLHSVGRVMKLSADDLDEGDLQTALNIQSSGPQAV